jgi:hypothetical protein
LLPIKNRCLTIGCLKLVIELEQFLVNKKLANLSVQGLV